MDDHVTLPAWRRLNAQITTSGQPTEEQLAEISGLGVAYVINLALHDHERALPDESGSVAALGMTYVHIPVIFDAPTEDDFRRFCEAMEKVGDAKVHVHCIVNARVSAFLFRWRRDVMGVDEAAARADMEAIWRPGGVWARFIGDEASVALPHRPPV